MDDRKITIRLDDATFRKFRIELINKNESAQSVLERCIKNYIGGGEHETHS